MGIMAIQKYNWLIILLVGDSVALHKYVATVLEENFSIAHASASSAQNTMKDPDNQISPIYSLT